MKPYTVHHWDTFDNETIKIGEFQSFEEAKKFVERQYKNRISEKNGADRVDIVHKGQIVEQFCVT